MTSHDRRAGSARAGSHRAVHRRALARGHRRRARSPSRTPPPARRWSRSPTRSPTTRSRRSPRPPTRRPSGPRGRRASAARSCAAPTRRSSRSADELALLMTLEMGKALAESRAEIAYAAEFFRWFSEEAVRIHGRYMVNTTGNGRHPHDAPAGRAVRVRHAVELPHGDGHAQDRPGDRRRLHDRRQARPADAAVDARAGEDPRGGGPARRACST